jgi:hypothetical protein
MREEEGMNRSIRKCFVTGIVVLGLLLAAGIPALASNSGKITLSRNAVLHGKNLPAGKYTVEWKTHSPEATVQFVQRYKVVLFTEGRVEKRDKVYDSNAVVYDVAPDGSMSIIEIRFANSNKVLVFN